MRFPYRTTREGGIDLDINNLTKEGEILVKTREDALALIAKIEKRLKEKLPKHIRAQFLNTRAIDYQTLGDPKMLDAALESYQFSKTAIPAFVLALAYHFHGQMNKAFEYYERAYRMPHGFGAELEIGFGYAATHLFKRNWVTAWDILAKNHKRIVYVLRQQNAGMLPEWRPGDGSKEVTIVQEGGYGDIFQYSRYLEYFRQNGIKATIYMTPTYFESGFVDFFADQDMGVKFASAKEIPAYIPAVGFLDFNFVFGVQANSVPGYARPWMVSSESEQKYSSLRGGSKPVIGLCWKAREKENTFCMPGVYRSLREDQAQRIIAETADKITWVNLQYGEETPNTISPERKTWRDTAGIIANCDAVVSVDTAPMHLAGAMGKPVYTVLSGMLEWKFGLPEQGDGCLWYPSMKVFRNGAFGFENSIGNVISFLKSSNVSPTHASISHSH